MPTPSAKYLLVEERLGRDLAGYLNDRRPATTYERIARELWTETEVDVTSQTVANWCAEVLPSPTEAAS